MKLEPGRVLERYRVERFLGEGGFSHVYQVRHAVLEKDFALKLLKVNRSDLRERLLQEGRVQAQLSHRNVVSVRDVVDVDDSPGLILDLVTDGNLEQLLDRRRPTVEEIDELGQGILRGVAAAHAIGLIDRDLKPSNVLLERTPDGMVPKVADFGLARVLMPDEELGASGTRSGIMMGTPCYMAPEQIESSASADERSDVFSLGSVLYELVCGRVAFDGDKLADILFHVANVRYRPLGEIVPDLPERMLETIAAALREHPGQRIQSAREMLAMWRGEIQAPDVVSVTAPGRYDLPPMQTAPTESPGPPEGRGRPPVGRMALVAAGTAAASAALVLLCVGGWRALRSGGDAAPGLSAEVASDIEMAEDPGVAASPDPAAADPVAEPAAEAPAEAVAVAEPAAEAVAVAEHAVDAPAEAVTVAEPAAEAVALAEPAVDAEGLPTSTVVVVEGPGVERAEMVRRADGTRVSAGEGVPAGLYDLVVWFTDEPEVPIDLGLRVDDGASVTVTCNADFYTCTTAERP